MFFQCFNWDISKLHPIPLSGWQQETYKVNIWLMSLDHINYFLRFFPFPFLNEIGPFPSHSPPLHAVRASLLQSTTRSFVHQFLKDIVTQTDSTDSFTSLWVFFLTWELSLRMKGYFLLLHDPICPRSGGPKNILSASGSHCHLSCLLVHCGKIMWMSTLNTASYKCRWLYYMLNTKTNI